MPLETEIIRNGKPYEPPHGWDYMVLSAMYSVCIAEDSPDLKPSDSVQSRTYKEIVDDGKIVDFTMSPIYYLPQDWCDLIGKGKQVLKKDYTFPIYTDGEKIELKKGDICRAWRSMK